MAKRRNNKPEPAKPWSNVFFELGELLIKNASSGFRLVINKGQALPLTLGTFLIVAGVRMPAQDLSCVAQSIVSKNFILYLGWPAALIVGIIGYVINRRQRRNSNDEMKRIVEERDALQRRLKIELQTSDND